MVGSPPLTRELRDEISQRRTGSGITPAYAGTTPSPDFYLTDHWDHPRLRGNYDGIFREVVPISGSPPLTRELP